MPIPGVIRKVTTAALALGTALLLALAALQSADAQPGSEGAASEGPVVFRDPLDDSPLDVPLPEGDQLTDAVAEFHQTGVDPYADDPEAIAAGRALYAQWCQACHLPDGTGRIGPSLVDERSNHPRTNTDLGMFEIIWAGGTGAMQSFADRLTQDQILQVIAHINELKRQAQGQG